MKKAILITAILLSSIWAYNSMIVSGSAPVCKINNSGTMAMCYYYSMSSCESQLTQGWYCIFR
jgi:hypothetical protein